MNRNTIAVVIVVIAGLGGYWAYESYQEHQRMQAWDSLLNDEGCDTCADRKSQMAKSRLERRADTVVEGDMAAQPEQGSSSGSGQ